VTQEKKFHPDHPEVAFVVGDGIGPDVSNAARTVIDAAVEKKQSGKNIVWTDVLAGEEAFNQTGEWLPEASINKIRKLGLALKGPLTTPVGEGFRSLNVTLRQKLDLYANVRPVRYFPGVPSPLTHPELLDVVIFRENTEDVYAGIEWAHDSEEAAKLKRFLEEEFCIWVREDTGLGIKPISRFATERITRKAFQYALENKRDYVTIVHKGNIMKYTEGAFLNWSLETIEREFPGKFVIEGQGEPGGKILVRNRIADNMFQQVLLRPAEHDVIITSNLNGDYLSDACVAQVGGLGLAPGANIGDVAAVFEAVHGTAPKYAGLDVANPSSVLLSGCMMLEHIGFTAAADATLKAIKKTIMQKKVTYDLARHIEDATELKSSEFATAVIENLD
jgi:isocitrate dehydrogenase